MNNYPNNDDVAPDPSAHVSQQVTLDGTVVDTDPVIIDVDDGFDQTRHVTFEKVNEPVTESQRITAFGTLTDDSTLAVEPALVPSP